MIKYLYSTLGVDSGLPVLENWIEHYLELGISKNHMRFVLHTQEDLSAINKIKQRLAKYSIEPTLVWRGRFSSGKNYLFRKKIWQSVSLRPEDWFLIADSDEFLTFGKPLNQVLTECNHTGFNAIEGNLVDCIALGGRIPKFYSQGSLAVQFPIRANVTKDLLNMNDLKIIAHKHNTFAGRMYRANHGISPEFGAANILNEECVIEHYKWVEGVLELIESRADYYCKIGRETDAQKNYDFLQLVENNQGRIPIESIATIKGTSSSAA